MKNEKTDQLSHLLQIRGIQFFLTRYYENMDFQNKQKFGKHFFLLFLKFIFNFFFFFS